MSYAEFAMARADLKTTDVSLHDAPFISADTEIRLRDLEVRTVRQLAARLEREPAALGEYLHFDDRRLDELRSATAAFVAEHFPEAALRRIYPKVHRRGVAADRLGDRSRPRFKGD